MLSSLRILAWRVVEHGRRVFVQQAFGAGAPSLQTTGHHQQTVLYRYLQQQQALKKSITGGVRPRGQGGGPLPSNSSSSGSISAVHPTGPLVGLLGRLRPLVSDAVRRLSTVSSRRLSNRRSLYRDTAPLFALVGVTLVGFEQEDEDDFCNMSGAATSRKQRGFVTRQEELEAICGSIREAVYRSGWLYDDESQTFTSDTTQESTAKQNLDENVHNKNSQNAKGVGQQENVNQQEQINTAVNITDENHVYTLEDLDLAGVIDKGCNAVVYAGRWKTKDSPESATTTSSGTSRATTSSKLQDIQEHDGSSPNEITLHNLYTTSGDDDNAISSSSVNTNAGSDAARDGDHVNTTFESATDNSVSSSSNDFQTPDVTFNSSSFNLNEFAGNEKTMSDDIKNQSSLFHHPSNNTTNSNFLSNLRLTMQDENVQFSSNSNPGQGLLSVLPMHGSSVSLCLPLTQPAFGEASEMCTLNLDSFGESRHNNQNNGFFGSNATNFERETDVVNKNLSNSNANYGQWSGRRRGSSLSEDLGLLLSSGGFRSPIHPSPGGNKKKVRFVAASSSNNRERSPRYRHESISETTVHDDSNTATERDWNQLDEASAEATYDNSRTSRLPPSSEYPLAVKLVFNYEAASNAPAILSALYRELIPARSVQLDDLYTSWRNDFFGESSHTLLSRHPNIVDMPCAFVDRIPLLQGGMQLYPTALPPRLNPHGFGRNMSLFCVMRRYDLSLDAYLTEHPQLSPRTSLLLLAQLLEALQHLHHHNISHRDLKPDNILLSLTEGYETPWLVLTDFGCCLAAGSKGGLSVPFVSREAEPRQGNAALMAPEVKTARPGLLKSINFSSCDLWAAGTLAYQFYGVSNPFLKHDGATPPLDSGSYRESQLPGMIKTAAPPAIRRLIADLLRRRPNNRPSPTIAATICQLALWGPSSWLNRHTLTKPKHQQVMEWLLCLTTKVLCERRGGSSGTHTEYRLVSTFLSRVRYTDVLQAISWNKAF